MANAQRGFQGMPANTAQLDMIELGDLSFAVEYRHVGVEQGPSVHVFGKVEGSLEEILRFDCFDKAPHYHYGFSYIDQPPVPIDPAAVGDPLTWVCSCIQSRLPQMLARAEASALSADCNPDSLMDIARTLEKRARDLMPDA